MNESVDISTLREHYTCQFMWANDGQLDAMSRGLIKAYHVLSVEGFDDADTKFLHSPCVAFKKLRAQI